MRVSVAVNCVVPKKYAMLILIVITVVRSESVRNIIRERRMLEHLNHPFICNLRYSFQDVEYLYVELLFHRYLRKRLLTAD